jgi:hypothetical protein
MSKAESVNGLAKMREPFPVHQISKMCRSTKKDNPKAKCTKCGGWHGLPAIQLDYVGHAALTDRLLDSDQAWFWEPLSVGDDGYPVIDGNGGMWIKLTVCGVTRYGYGDAQGKVGGDAMKERIGDALRNAAMRFGAALDLWHKGDLHIEEEPLTPTEQFVSKASEKGVTPSAGALENFSEDEQKFIKEFSEGIQVNFDSGTDHKELVKMLEERHLATEEKVAVWSLLDSKCRSAIKKAKASHTPEELAAQA